MPIRSLLMSLCAMVLLTGCAESMKMYDMGQMWKQEHHIPPTFTKPAHTEYTKCNKQAVKWSVTWAMEVCASTLDDNAPLAYEQPAISGPSYAAMVIPGLSSGVPIGLGFGLGSAYGGSNITQNAAANQSVSQPGPWRGQYGHR